MMAAAMWTKPHVIAFDEPTNYLDFQLPGCTSCSGPWNMSRPLAAIVTMVGCR